MIAVLQLTCPTANQSRGVHRHPALLLHVLLAGLLLNAPATGLAVEAADPKTPEPTFTDVEAGPNAMADVEGRAEPPADGPVVNQSSLEMPYREAIEHLEAGTGAYAEGLSEELLGLGLVLQRQGRHGEALKVFKRGVHLARINYGLYSGEQLPLLQAEISSHLAMGQLAAADERQQYLYRVQTRSLDSGEMMSAALMQQANWQYTAYVWDVGGPQFLRLMNMWDLYRLALNDIVARKGETSEDLLPPLRGMLRAQYLISEYQGESGGSGFNAGESYSGTLEYNRFNAYRHQNYDKGRAVIQAIYEVELDREQDNPVGRAEALVMLGDWYLWHDKREDAHKAYHQALAELADLDDAQLQAERLLGRPVALPDLKGVRPLPAAVEPDTGDILLEFDVNARGRVVDLERIDDNELADGGDSYAHRLMRRLRKTPFRPRFENGEPVTTENIVWGYEFEE